MQYTQNYQLRKPTRGIDRANVDDENYNMDRLDALVNASQNSIGEAYDESETYNAGDCAMKDGLLYECLEDGVTGAWDATKWQRTTATAHGTGGSSVEANPQGTPTDDLDTIGINGTIYNIAGSGGGGGNVYGAFIDTNRVIKANTTVEVGTVAEYTATEDCIVICEYYGSDNDGNVKVDDVIVSQVYVPYGTIVNNVETIFLKSGQTIKIKTVSYTGRYIVYGLTFGTQNIFTPQIYSTEERCVGVWIDNKPLYAKSVNIAQYAVTLRNTEWTNLFSVSNIEALAKSEVHHNSPNTSQIVRFQASNGYIQGASTNDIYLPNYGELYVTFYYTKTTDTAGSGSYNTLGVPMVHYADDTETVVGTLNGKTFYEKVFVTPDSVSGNSSYFEIPSAEDVVLVGGYADIGTAQLPLNFIMGSFNNLVFTFWESASSRIVAYIQGWTIQNWKIIARYTKITD